MASDEAGGGFGEKISEGQATVYLPKDVFYNPVQEFNRDLTITVISEYGAMLRREQQAKLAKKAQSNAPKSGDDSVADGDDDNIRVSTGYEQDDRRAGVRYEDGLRILEGLAASGLRSVRFSKEIPGVHSVIGNDFSRAAVRCMQANIELNDVGHLMSASCEDAAMLMYAASRRKGDAFDVIDLDPYGGPTQFLDGAVQSVKDGGLLCVTCTDMAVLCGNGSEKCFAAYGAASLKSGCCHEMALRIVLRTIDSYANRYARYVVPLLSVSVDFYCRVFVRVFSGAKLTKNAVSRSAMVYECTGCSAAHLQPLGRCLDVELPNGQRQKKYTFAKGPVIGPQCQHCHHPHHIGGPIWSDPLHDMEFVRRLIQRARRDAAKFSTSKRIVGMMTIVSEELEDTPLYYLPDRLCGVLHLTSPSFLQFRSALLNAGYRVSLSHASLKSLKTDAPMDVIWDVLRAWNKIHPVKAARLIEGTPCAAILSKEPETAVSFELHKDAEPPSREQGLLRYQTNMKDWGPKARASSKGAVVQSEKRKQNQNKRAAKRQRNDSQGEYYKQFECVRFKQGTCDYGDDCKYQHVSPKEENMAAGDDSGDSKAGGDQ